MINKDSLVGELLEVVEDDSEEDSVDDSEEEAIEDLEEWGWETEGMETSQTSSSTNHEEVDEDYNDVIDEDQLPNPDNDTGSNGREGTGTERKRDGLTVGEFASLAEDRGERGWTEDEWKEWWNEAQKSEQALEINDFYRIWIKDEDDAPEAVEVKHADEIEVEAPADNTHFYEVPFTVSTAMVPVGKADDVLERRPDREQFPMLSDLRHVPLPETDLSVVKAATYGKTHELTPSVLRQVQSPLTLAYTSTQLGKTNSDTAKEIVARCKRELDRRGVVGISRHARTSTVETGLISKYKVYVDSEDEVPDEYEVQYGAQGGIYYEPTTDSDEEEEKEGEEVGASVLDEDLEFNGFGVGRFDTDEMATELKYVEPGDRLYVEHPDEPDYIAEISGIDINGDDWEVSFGGGSYHLREDTNSQPVGLVTDEPTLGENQEVQTITSAGGVTNNVETGDVVTYNDPAGYTHYNEVEGWTPEGDIVSDDEIIDRADVTGVVNSVDPTEEYELNDEDWISENTNIGNVEGAVEFGEELAKAVENGDATDIVSYNYRDYVSSITDEDLVIKAHRQIVQNDGTKTQRDKIEGRMRALGLNPEEYKPGEMDYNPDTVPESRKKTVYSSFDGEKARKTAAAVIQNNNISNSNWESYNDFFDTMTQGELVESLKTTVSNNISTDIYGGPLSAEDTIIGVDDTTPGYHDVENNANLGSLWSRLEGTKEQQVEIANDVIDSASQDYQKYVATSAATWLPDPEARREIYEDRFDSPQDVDNKHRARMIMQFGDTHTERAREVLDRYTTSTDSEDTQFVRAAAMSLDENEASSRFNSGIAVEPVEPTEEMAETFQNMRDRTAEYIENVHGGEVTLYRGLKDSVSSNASLESWTDDLSTADSAMFDNHAVVEATFEAGDILACHQIDDYDQWAYGGYGENEWTALGGPIAEQIPEEMSLSEVMSKEGSTY